MVATTNGEKLEKQPLPLGGPLVRERTTMQVLTAAGPDGMLPPNILRLAAVSQQGWAKKVRQMRRDPTIGILRDMYVAPAMASEWTVTCDDPQFEKAVANVQKSTVPFRLKFLEDAFRGLMDFGWQAFETPKRQNEDGTFYIEKYKGLLQDFTDILVDEFGRLIGVLNQPIFTTVGSRRTLKDQLLCDLYRGECLCVYREAEGTNWYGEALMRRVEKPYDEWNEADDAARRFDNKVAGATWVLWYPLGTSKLNGVDDVDNAEVAKEILRTVSSSGKVMIPRAVLKQFESLNEGVTDDKLAWRLELISAQVQQSSFIDRLKYIDALKARGMGIPERAIFEGQFGTKAEAEAHADFAIDNLERQHSIVLELLNDQAVDPLVEMNDGPDFKGHIKVTATPLSDAKRAFIRNTYTAYLNSPNGWATEARRLDIAAMREQLGLPVTKTLEQDEGEPGAIGPEQDTASTGVDTQVDTGQEPPRPQPGSGLLAAGGVAGAGPNGRLNGRGAAFSFGGRSRW